MTPYQKLKHLVLVRSDLYSVDGNRVVIKDDNVDELYDDVYDDLQDALYALRSGDVVTNVPHEYSRHYESKSVAVQTPDGSWVGWTYWYGGGKHGEPEAEPWMNRAYNLSCTEEQKLVTIRTFKKED